MNIKCISNTGFASYPKIPLKVDERLIRGAAVTNPFKLLKLKKQGVTQIIDLRNTSFERPFEKFFCRLFGIKYMNHRYSYRLNSVPEHDFFENVNNDILNNKGLTYMHCQYGKHRTGICTAVYEKEHTNKSQAEIVDNIFKLGFTEVLERPVFCNVQKEMEILDDFFHKYYPFKNEIPT